MTPAEPPAEEPWSAAQLRARLDRWLEDPACAGYPSLDSDARETLVAYVGLLARWNRIHNLTAVREPQAMLVRHVLDSLAVAPRVRGPRVLDAGTGAGVPGLILAIARPDWHCVLLDSSAKKLRFCVQAMASLALRNVEIVHRRIEDYRPQEPFDTVVSRAFTGVGRLLALSRALVAADGQVVAMIGRVEPRELAEAVAIGENARVVALSVPGGPRERHAAIVRRVGDPGGPAPDPR